MSHSNLHRRQLAGVLALTRHCHRQLRAQQQALQIPDYSGLMESSRELERISTRLGREYETFLAGTGYRDLAALTATPAPGISQAALHRLQRTATRCAELNLANAALVITRAGRLSRLTRQLHQADGGGLYTGGGRPGADAVMACRSLGQA